MSNDRSGADDAEKLIVTSTEASKRELTNWFTFLTPGT